MGGKAAVKSGRKRSDDFTVTGAGMGVAGGAFLGVSILLAWVSFHSLNLDVFDLMDAKFIYIVILVAQMLGVLQAGLSLAMLRSAGWPAERKKYWSIPLLTISLVIFACIVIGIVMVELDYVQDASVYTYGPAAFLSIFGVVLCTCGALLFVMDVKAKQPGAVQKPVKRGPDFTELKHNHQVRFSSECPGCGADVSDDMAVCPECGAVLGGKSEEVEEVDDLGDDDVDKVR